MLRPHRPVAIVLTLALLSACGGGGGGAEGGNGAAALAAGPSAGNAASGQVLAPGGAPLAGVTVTAYKTNDHTSVSTSTDAAGRYAFSGLESGPQVVYEIWADKAGFGFFPSTSAPAAVVRRSDYNGLYRTVIRYVSQPGAALAAADFTAYDGSTRIASLAATGQTASHAPGDDGAQRRGTSTAGARFSDNLDGTITDRLTGLVWLRDAGCLGATQWSAALQAANQLASGQCGLSDGSSAGQWRLPNIVELESLVDVSRGAPALPAGQPFVGAAASYWSSTTYYGDVGSAWVLRLADGRFLNDLVANAKASATHATWAVRGTGGGGALRLMASGQYVSYAAGDDGAIRAGVPHTYPRFIDSGNGTLTDTMTGLVWLKKADCLHQSWSAALDAVAQLASGQCGLSDGSTPGQWRMPNRAEMLSLADRALGNHADYFSDAILRPDQSVERPAIFTHLVTAEYYWTSSTDAAAPSSAWTLYSCDFGVYDVAKSAVGYTLAVR